MRKAIGVLGMGMCVAMAFEACVGDEPSSSGENGSDSGSDSAISDGSTGDASTTNDSGGGGDAGSEAGTTQPSCVGLAANCGQLANQNCCASSLVDGGSFLRDYDGVLDASPLYADGTHSATVSGFQLDVFPVTISRFRNFVAAYPGDKPASDGEGKNPHNPDDPGWSTAWNALMPSAEVDLVSALDSCSMHSWTDEADAGVEAKPINCATWYEAYAFCIWDGGRLATSAEYNFAESGGNEQRVYPWSNPPSSQTIDSTLVVMSMSPGGGPAVVGSTPLGNGKFGQSDLTGNLEEWTVDTGSGGSETPPSTCNDCAVFDAGTSRVARSGAYFAPAGAQRSGRTFAYLPASAEYFIGFRCARD